MIARLVYCKNGTKAKIEKFNGGNGAINQCEELGLRENQEIEVISINSERGPVIVKRNDDQISIGRELASKIIISTDDQITITLDKLKSGDIAEVTNINPEAGIRMRLIDMGLIKGITLEVIRYAPLGDPIEIKLKGFNLSLRLSEAQSIEVKLLKYAKQNGSQRRGGWFSFNKD